MSVLAWILAADLLARAVRHRDAVVEAEQMVRQADRYLAYMRRRGTPAQIAHAQRLADAWRAYRNSL